MPNNKQQSSKFISLADDAKAPDTFGLERFMQEVNILELEGYYFCPNKNQAGDLSRRTISPGEIADRPVTIVFSDYGRPGELAYKVLQAAFFKLSEERFETNGWVSFSWREFLGLMGLTVGGRQTKDGYRVLKQLENTEINCAIRYKLKQPDGSWKEKWRAGSFRIIMTLSFEGDERGQFARTAFQLHDVIVQNFKNRHVSYFNWERMRGLSMVGMMLYKRFFRHWANIYRDGVDPDELVFDKNYVPICTTWLGLKPFTQKSRIEEQLRSLDDLIERRLLRAWEVTKGKEGQWKVIACPGTGFFADYENMYRRKRPAREPQRVEPEPLMFLHNFHKQLGREQEEFAPKEVAYVRDLLTRYGEAGVHDFVNFGLTEARRTNFDMQWFGALSLYEGKWQAAHHKKVKAQERQAAIAACAACNDVGMLEFVDGAVGECPHDAKRISHIHARKPIRGFSPA